MKAIVTRSFGAEFQTREENGESIVEGRPVVLNSRIDLGFCDEVIDSRALDGTDLTDVRLCLNHDTGYVYARSRRNNGNSTMQIYTDVQGLRFRARLNTEDSPKAKDFYSAVSRGDMDKMSFMFTVDGYEWENLETDHPTRRITKIGSIFEISCVTFPAYDTTSIEARSTDELDSIKREMEIARQTAERTVDTDTELRLAKAKYNYLKTCVNGGKNNEQT